MNAVDVEQEIVEITVDAEAEDGEVGGSKWLSNREGQMGRANPKKQQNRRACCHQISQSETPQRIVSHVLILKKRHSSGKCRMPSRD